MSRYEPNTKVSEILRAKRAGIKAAPLPAGSPTWAELLAWTWAEIEDAAGRGEPGMRTVRKLPSDSRFDR